MKSKSSLPLTNGAVNQVPSWAKPFTNDMIPQIDPKQIITIITIRQVVTDRLWSLNSALYIVFLPLIFTVSTLGVWLLIDE
ncbi:MAG: hypothetical protein ABI425_05825 [Patescibacteria group bacterium]